MRRPIVAGNWKMHKAGEEADALARKVVSLVGDVEAVDVVICPPFPSLERVARVLEGERVMLGAQHVHWESEGAFTGEVSPGMLLTCCCRWVILGHSERRTWFGETDETVNRRLKATISSGLNPIVCVGERLEERKSGQTEAKIKEQVEGAFQGLSSEQAEGVVVAYEPVWAIGTGETATPEQAEAVHHHIRGLLERLYSSELAEVVRIQYGGSVKPENAADLFARSDIDGGLIGGASLEADSFSAIVKAAS